jgi:hypothetical protein
MVNAQTCPDLGLTPKMNTGSHNYVVDLFQDTLLFTYAIDQCTATSLIPGTWYKYECVQGDSSPYTWMVTKTAYGTDSCSSGGSIVATYYETTGDDFVVNDTTMSYSESVGNKGYFVCTGDNAYASVSISTSSNCGVSQTLYAGLGGCTFNRPLLTQFYCQSSYGLVQFFLNETFYHELVPTTQFPYEMCDPGMYCAHWNFTKSCGLLDKLFGKLIYGKINSCQSSMTTTTTISTTKAGYLPAVSLLNIVLGLFVSWYFA